MPACSGAMRGGACGPACGRPDAATCSSSPDAGVSSRTGVSGIGRRAGRLVGHAHSRTTSGRPASTDMPSCTSTSRTVPARPAESAFSIFMASMTTTGWRASTWSPGRTRTRTTLPGIGAMMRSGPSAAPRPDAPPPHARRDHRRHADPLHVHHPMAWRRLRFDDDIVHRAVRQAQAEAAVPQVTHVAASGRRHRGARRRYRAPNPR